MASQSRGSIEEGTVSFTNHTERVITFTAASGANFADFPSPPVVKLISVGDLSAPGTTGQKNLIFDNDNNIAATYTYPEFGTVTIATGLTPTNNTVASNYSFLNNITSKTKAKVLEKSAAITVPFDNTGFSNVSKVQIFFQLKFTGYDLGTADDFRLRFINKATIDSASDSIPSSSSQQQTLSYQLFINDSGAWKSVESGTNTDASINATELNAAKASALVGSSDFQWFRLDLASSSEDVADLAGLYIRNLSSSNGETIHITNFLVLHHSTGTIPDRIGDVFADTIQNSNIGVTFTNVTTTGMTVITSAPFTGTIRYLCSVQG